MNVAVLERVHAAPIEFVERTPRAVMQTHPTSTATIGDTYAAAPNPGGKGRRGRNSSAARRALRFFR